MTAIMPRVQKYNFSDFCTSPNLYQYSTELAYKDNSILVFIVILIDIRLNSIVFLYEILCVNQFILKIDSFQY